MRDNNINVIMISQASSEHSVCFAVKSADTEAALQSLSKRWVGGRCAPGRAVGGRRGAPDAPPTEPADDPPAR